MLVNLRNVKVIFPNFYVKTAAPDCTPKYNCIFVLDKQEHASLITEIKDKIASIAKTNNLTLASKGDGNPLKDNDISDKPYDYCDNTFTISAKSHKPIKTWKKNNTEAFKEDNLFKPGCQVNGQIRLYFYKKGKTGIAAQLVTVQYLSEGDRIITETEVAEDTSNVFKDETTGDDLVHVNTEIFRDDISDEIPF